MVIPLNELIQGIGKVVNKSRTLILGAAFKENVPDTRNSKVFHLVKELKKYGVETHVCDPFIEHEKVLSLFSAKPVQWPLDGMVWSWMSNGFTEKRISPLLLFTSLYNKICCFTSGFTFLQCLKKRAMHKAVKRLIVHQKTLSVFRSSFCSK